MDLQILWRNVLRQALEDVAIEGRGYFTKENEDLKIVCDFAGVPIDKAIALSYNYVQKE